MTNSLQGGCNLKKKHHSFLFLMISKITEGDIKKNPLSILVECFSSLKFTGITKGYKTNISLVVNTGQGPDFAVWVHPSISQGRCLCSHLQIWPTVARRNIFLHPQQVSTRITLTLLVSWATLGPHYNLAAWRISAVSYITCTALIHAEIPFPPVSYNTL